MSQVDYIIGGAFILFVWILLLRCHHDWQLVDKTEMESRLETAIKVLGKFDYIWPSEIVNAAARRLVLAMRCTKCGKSKIHVIDSK